MRLGLVLLTSAFVAAAACSCSSLEGIASEPPPSSDSGSDTSSTDDGASATDASSAPPASADTGVDAATGFCASLKPAPTFCLDFDDGAPLSSVLGESTSPVAPACTWPTSAEPHKLPARRGLSCARDVDYS